MKKIRTTIYLLFLTVSVFYGQNNAFDFLRLDSSPRASALGGAYIAETADPNVIFYNPAGIVNTKNIPVSFSYLKHIAGINSFSLSSAFDFMDLGKFATAIQYINYGSFDERDAAGTKLGTFSAGDFAFTLAYGNNVNNRLFYGGGIKFVYSGIADVYSMGILGDFGLQYIIPESNWKFGLSLLNMGRQISYYGTVNEEMPFSVQLGFSKKLAHTPLQIFFAFTRLNDEDRFKYINAGAEITLSKIIQLRVGYDNKKREEFKVASSAGLGGFSFGLGIAVRKYHIDYAFNSMGSIGAMHRIGITTSFN